VREPWRRKKKKGKEKKKNKNEKKKKLETSMRKSDWGARFLWKLLPLIMNALKICRLPVFSLPVRLHRSDNASGSHNKPSLLLILVFFFFFFYLGPSSFLFFFSLSLFLLMPDCFLFLSRHDTPKVTDHSIDGRLYRWHAVRRPACRLTQLDVFAGPTRHDKRTKTTHK
jgi:hypothetical protein